MIYLASIYRENLSEIKERFQAGGIPIFVEPDFSKRDIAVTGVASAYRRATSSPEWYRINVCLDKQLEEASALFKDASYIVKTPVNIAEFDSILNELGENNEVTWRPSDKSLNKIVGVVLVGFVLWVLYAILFPSSA